MPFKWSNGNMPVQLGGPSGDGSRDNTTDSWPRYEAEYLKQRLSRAHQNFDKYYVGGKPDTFTMEPDGEGHGQGLDINTASQAATQVYLDKISRDYKKEADEQLKHEFNLWLEGKHAANSAVSDTTYKNGEGKARRVYTYRDEPYLGPEGQDPQAAIPAPPLNMQVGDTKHNWQHTPWGNKQLTHLPGVRDYLREQAMNASKAEEYLNILAEYGPQDLEQAWLYFKHWVKGKPASEVIMPQTAESEKQQGMMGNSKDLNYDADYISQEGFVRAPAFTNQPIDVTTRGAGYSMDSVNSGTGNPRPGLDPQVAGLNVAHEGHHQIYVDNPDARTGTANWGGRQPYISFAAPYAQDQTGNFYGPTPGTVKQSLFPGSGFVAEKDFTGSRNEALYRQEDAYAARWGANEALTRGYTKSQFDNQATRFGIAPDTRLNMGGAGGAPPQYDEHTRPKHGRLGGVATRYAGDEYINMNTPAPTRYAPNPQNSNTDVTRRRLSYGISPGSTWQYPATPATPRPRRATPATPATPATATTAIAAYDGNLPATPATPATPAPAPATPPTATVGINRRRVPRPISPPLTNDGSSSTTPMDAVDVGRRAAEWLDKEYTRGRVRSVDDGRVLQDNYSRQRNFYVSQRPNQFPPPGNRRRDNDPQTRAFRSR